MRVIIGADSRQVRRVLLVVIRLHLQLLLLHREDLEVGLVRRGHLRYVPGRMLARALMSTAILAHAIAVFFHHCVRVEEVVLVVDSAGWHLRVGLFIGCGWDGPVVVLRDIVGSGRLVAFVLR